MKRWLVTGGAGFIGSYVCRALLRRGDDVRVLDDFSDAPYPSALKRRNTGDLGREFGARIEVVEGCVTDAALAPRMVDGVNGIVHLAGLAGVRPSFAAPARYAKVNVEGTACLLDAAQRAGVEVFALASTSSVYGNDTPLPASEDSPAIVPESPYAASKRGAELVTAALLRKTPAMRAPALRFFTVYGPRQRPDMAIATFIQRILSGKSITIFGDGSMRRDFTHADDIARGVLAALDTAPAGFRTYNLGSGAPVTLSALVDAMASATGRRVDVEHTSVPLGDVAATYADIERARRELGWSPRVKLEEGLASVVDWLSK